MFAFTARSFAGLTILTFVVASGCAGAEVENPVAGNEIVVHFDTLEDGDPEDKPPGSSNPFDPVCFWNPDVQAAYRLFAQTPLSADAQGTLPDNPHLDQAPATCRAQALKFLARCALHEGSTMTDPDTGIMYRGWLGLADPWRTQALSNDDQWWVTSCLLDHLNGYGVVVPILLQGARAELQPTAAQSSAFPVAESRAWGNLFAPNFVANVCYFDDVANACDVSQVLNERICDTSPYCNLNLVGSCDSACTYDILGGSLQCGSSGNKHIIRHVKDYGLYGSDCGSSE